MLAALPLAAGENSWTPILAEAASIPFPIPTGDPAVVYGESQVGYVRSGDGGRHWSRIEVPVFARTLVVDPRDSDVVFAPGEGYLLRSDDGGKSWVVALVDSQAIAGFSFKVLVSRHFPGRVYAVSSASVWQSQDGGVSFSRRSATPGNPDQSVLDLAEAADGVLYFDRRDPCGMYGCGPHWRIDRSADQGQSFTPLWSNETGDPAVTALVPHPSRPQGIYFVQNIDGARHLMYSDDRGASSVDRGEISGYLLVDPARPEALYNAGGAALRRSDDRGVSWQDISLPDPGLISRGLFMVASPGRLLYHRVEYFTPQAGQATAFATGDGGASWSPLRAEGLLPSPVADAVVSGPAGDLYTLWYGGELAHSPDGGASWEQLEAPYIAFNLVGDPVDGDTLYAVGSLDRDGDSGILRSRDGGRTFSLVLAVDSSPLIHDMVAFRRGEATTLVAWLGDDQVARSADGGDTWVVGSPQGWPAGSRIFQRLVVDGATVYGHGNQLYGSTDGGATWQPRPSPSVVGNLVGGGGILARLDVYASVLHSSVDGGTTWQSYDLPFPVHLDDASGNLQMQLAADRFGALYLREQSMLLRSRDRGRTWQALTADLPGSAWSDQLVVDPADRDHLYLAGYAGLHEGRFPQQRPLALLRGRFEATLRWRSAPQAEWTTGPAASLSDQSGVFHLFTAERAEVAVQMLDGRMLGGRIWVFVAAMTDVEIELEVEDRLTGEVWRHHQGLGEMKSVVEFAAFPRQPQPSGGTLKLPFGGLVDPQPTVAIDNRFVVSVTYKAAGVEHEARGRRLLDDTAGFTFFDPGAVDILVNVIDGRSLNGKFWVFGGSLSDTEFVVRIEDLATGAIKTYRNPPGQYAGFSDTSAF